MTHLKKGAILPILILIIALLGLGGGTYVYYKNKLVPVTEVSVVQEPQVTVATSTPSATPEVSVHSVGIPHEVECDENSKYFIITKTVDDGMKIGAQSIVKYKTDKNKKYTCEYIVEKGDYEIMDSWDLLVLAGDKLILDIGTTVERTFLIYDLKLKKEVYRGGSHGSVVVKDGMLEWWDRTNDKITEQNCAEYFNNKDYDYRKYFSKEYIENNKDHYYSELTMDGKFLLNLDTLIKTDSGERQCAYHD